MKHRAHSLLLVAALSVFLARDLSAQTGYAAYESTITASDHAGGDMFGGSVAVSFAGFISLGVRGRDRQVFVETIRP